MTGRHYCTWNCRILLVFYFIWVHSRICEEFQ